MGPCVNTVPARANISSGRTSGDLTLSMQEQNISLGEADSLGLKNFIEHCTNWPVDSTFDSNVHFPAPECCRASSIASRRLFDKATVVRKSERGVSDLGYHLALRKRPFETQDRCEQPHHDY